MLFLVGDKIEAALVILVSPVVSGVQVLPGKSASDKQPPPVIICSAEEDGDEEPPHSGNFFVNGSVAIKSSAVTNEAGMGEPAPDPKSADQALVSAVFGAVRVANLAELLSAAVPDLTVFPVSVIFVGTERGRDKLGVWNDVLHFRCLACGQALGA
jgi:hypothetical protein